MRPPLGALTVDYILFLSHSPSIEVNPNEVSDTKWVSKEELEAFFKDPGASLICSAIAARKSPLRH